MIEDLYYYCRELEAFIQKNQIQELQMESMDTLFIENLMTEIQKESQKIPDDFKRVNSQIPWQNMDSFWQEDLTRAYEYIDLKMLYAIAAHEIPKIASALHLLIKRN
ncbi:MAG: hypothetical protein GW938_17395 [Leptospira sp.]|jgi:uncharacterized protein with HEPN domain|nr:hypothetical protein [Leptospira sp.]NCS94210.1 hypothetical protein [Leptospira sp.]